MGIANFHLEKYAASIYCLERMALKEEPAELIYNYLGLAYFERQQHAKSEAAFKKALQKAISDKTGAYYSYLGLNQYHLENYAAAIKSFQESYRFKEDPLMYYYMARSYDDKYADKKPAQKYYERFLAESAEAENPFVSFSEERLSQFKTADHFKKDTAEK